MSKSNASKSKEFIEKERKARESLRLSIERELVGDMIRLLDDKLYCDITFVIDDNDFPAHVAILSARAPAFSQKFLPQLLTPREVQSCIYIQDIKPEEFSVFLRSVYTEIEVKDYSSSEYPWTEKVSWFYPKDVEPEQYEMCNGLEDSIEESEESEVIDQTDYNDESKSVDKEDSRPDKEETLSCTTQSENISEISSTCCISNGTEEDSVSSAEVNQQHVYECGIKECQSSEPSARTKEIKKSGRLNGEELNLIEMEACCKIGKDLLTLVNDCKTSDVTFLLNDTERIKSHRSILCTRSSYFSAMLYGGWTEGQANEIPLYGIQSSKAFLVVLYYLYGGITRIPLEIADICEVLRLSDMYGLEGLREVISCQLRIDKCHLFHKPCSDCIAGVIDCLDVSDLFQISDLKSQSLRWIAKYFDRVYGTKNFASLSKTLQEETLAIIQSTMNVSNVLDLFSRGEKLSANIPRIKWAEPVLSLVSSHMDSCLSYIASNFPVIARQQAFLDMLKGVGWSTPLLEKIFTAVRKHLTINNCCEQLKEAMRLQSILNADVPEEGGFEKQFSEESYKLVDSLQSRCQEFLVSNLNRVAHTQGWKHLGLKTQNEIRKSKGGLFVDIGLPGQAKNSASDPTKKPPFGDKTRAKNPSSLRASTTGSTSRGRPQSSTHSSNNTRRGCQDRPSASATGEASRGRPQGSASSADRTRRSVPNVTLNGPSVSATGVASRGRPQGSASSADRTRRSVPNVTLNGPSVSATGEASRARPSTTATSDRTRRSVPNATSNGPSVSATGVASRASPSTTATSDRIRRSVPNATSNGPSVSATGVASRARPQGSASSADRTRRSVPNATSSGPSVSATGVASRGRPQGSASSADRTRRSVPNVTLNGPSVSVNGVASRARPSSTATSDRTRRSIPNATSNGPSVSATGVDSRARPPSSATSDRTRRSVAKATLNGPSVSATGVASRARPSSTATSNLERTRKSVQDATSNRTLASATGLASRDRPQGSASSAGRTRRKLPTTSGIVKGNVTKNATLNASVSQNLSKQDSSLRNSSHVATSRPISSSISNKKKPNPSKTDVSSVSHPVELPHGLSRSCSDFNRAKIVDKSGRKYFSDPSISERGRTEEDKRLNKSSKPRDRISRSITKLDNTNPSLGRVDQINRMKLARESFVGPVRLAQRGKSRPNDGDQKKKRQNVSAYSNEKYSDSSTTPKHMETQNDKRPLDIPAQSIPSSQSSNIQNQTIIISTGSGLDAPDGELTPSGVSSAEDDSILLSEAVEASPVQEGASLSLSSSVQESKVLTQDDDSLRTTEARALPSSSSLSSVVPESGGSSEFTSPSTNSSSSSCDTENLENQLN